MNKVELYNEFWKEKKTVDYLFIKKKKCYCIESLFDQMLPKIFEHDYCPILAFFPITSKHLKYFQISRNL